MNILPNTVFTEWITANAVIPYLIDQCYDPRIIKYTNDALCVSLVTINEQQFSLIPPEDRDLFQKLVIEFTIMVVEHSRFNIDRYINQLIDEKLLSIATDDLRNKIRHLEERKEFNVKKEFLKVLGVESVPRINIRNLIDNKFCWRINMNNSDKPGQHVGGVQAGIKNVLEVASSNDRINKQLKLIEEKFEDCKKNWLDLPEYVYTDEYKESFLDYAKSRLKDDIKPDYLAVMILHHEVGNRIPYFDFLRGKK